MPNTREKLIELLDGVMDVAIAPAAYAVIADHLIANGVTVQKWISVNDRLPKPETDVIAFVGDYIDILSYRYDRRGNLAFMYMDDSGWWHERIRPSVTHWQYLPQPPKGE